MDFSVKFIIRNFFSSQLLVANLKPCTKIVEIMPVTVLM